MELRARRYAKLGNPVSRIAQAQALSMNALGQDRSSGDVRVTPRAAADPDEIGGAALSHGWTAGKLS
jgi:hypothetical protein